MKHTLPTSRTHTHGRIRFVLPTAKSQIVSMLRHPEGARPTVVGEGGTPSVPMTHWLQAMVDLNPRATSGFDRLMCQEQLATWEIHMRPSRASEKRGSCTWGRTGDTTRQRYRAWAGHRKGGHDRLSCDAAGWRYWSLASRQVEQKGVRDPDRLRQHTGFQYATTWGKCPGIRHACSSSTMRARAPWPLVLCPYGCSVIHRK